MIILSSCKNILKSKNISSYELHVLGICRVYISPRLTQFAIHNCSTHTPSLNSHVFRLGIVANVYLQTILI